jgi:hypothetical protein
MRAARDEELGHVEGAQAGCQVDVVDPASAQRRHDLIQHPVVGVKKTDPGRQVDDQRRRTLIFGQSRE